MPQAGPAFSNYPAVLGCPDLLLKKRKKNKTVAGITQDQQNFDKVGSNGLGAFGSCPIPDVNFLFIFYFFLTGPKGDNDGC